MTQQEEITRRRTFAVIAHPDAGKTTLTEKLLPNESTTLTVWHHVRDRVTDPSYTITAAGGINENGTVYLDYPDIGISQMEVIAESAGKRTVRMTLYNSSAATLAGGKSREVKLAFYADDLHTKPAPQTAYRFAIMKSPFPKTAPSPASIREPLHWT